MARIRSIKPEFWSDRKLARLTSREARTLYIALWNLADEHGRLNGDTQWLKGQVFPYDDDVDAQYIGKLLAELENPALGTVVAYEADGDPYLLLPKLGKHQRLEPDKVASRLPAPPCPDEPGSVPDDLEPAAGRSAAPDHSTHPDADPSESRADLSAPGADSSALLYVAGSREHVAGSREQVPRRAHAVPNAPQTQLTEVPEDFKPTDAMRRWANTTHPGLDLDFETDQFIRYWRSEGRRKKSWVDAWQKWIADSHKRGARAGPAAAAPRQQATDAQFDRAMERARAREGMA